MTSVNSPACLLARNCFYRNLPSSPEQMKPAFPSQNDSIGHKQKQVNLCVTKATPPGGIKTKGLCVNIVLGSSSLNFSTSKPNSSAEQGRPAKENKRTCMFYRLKGS